MRSHICRVVIVAVLVLAAASCDLEEVAQPSPTDEAPAPEAETTPETEVGQPDEQTEAQQDDAEEETGTPQDPLPAGSEITLDTWRVVVGETTSNATEMVLGEGEFNEPPVEGRQFVLVPVTATYIGEESGTLWADMTFTFVGSAGNTFGTGTDDFCGVIPDDLYEAGEAFQGAEVAGNVCISVPSDQVDGGSWMLEDIVSLNGNRYFIGLE